MEIRKQIALGEREKRQIAEIYHHSFPASERMDFDIVEKRVESKELLLFIAYSDMQIVGFGVVNTLSSGSACLFEYLAIRQDKQSLGIGSKLLSHIIMALSSDDHVLGMLLEVEPIEGAPPKEVSMRKKRIAFYERFGATRLDIVPNYYMPDLSGSGYIPMSLMWLPLKAKESELSTKEIKEFIKRIYICSYSADPNNKQLMKILDGMK